MTDLELYLMPDPSTIEGLSWRLWLDVCRALLKEVGSEERSRLALMLAGLSDELVQMVEVDMTRLEREGSQVMARHLKALQRGGDFELKELTNIHAKELSERDQVTLITLSGAERYEGKVDLVEVMRGREREVRAGFAMMYCPAGEFRMGSEVGWFGENAYGETHSVAQKKSNTWGLYDMSGNVWEWCNDQWDTDAYKSRPKVSIDPCLYASSPALRVNRGGGWYFVADFCRVADRNGDNADRRWRNLGGRLLRWNIDT